MTLQGLFNKLKEKGFHYFIGNTNDRDDSIYLEFSTLYNGKGNVVELAINQTTYDVTFIIEGERLMVDDIGEIQLFDFINKLL